MGLVVCPLSFLYTLFDEIIVNLKKIANYSFCFAVKLRFAFANYVSLAYQFGADRTMVLDIITQCHRLELASICVIGDHLC